MSLEVMELAEQLALIDAPAALVERATAEAWVLEDAWDAVDHAEHRVWLAACVGAPIERMVEAAAAAVVALLDGFVEPSEPLARAVEMAVGGATAAELVAAAEACEALAEGGVGSYRGASAPGFEAGARAAALCARAAEGYLSGQARRESARLEQARHTGALVGAGAQIVLPARAGPARLDVRAAGADPAQGAFLFVVAASAGAVAEAVEGLGRTRPDAAAEIDRVVREALEDEDDG